jgi:hypothetical protein
MSILRSRKIPLTISAITVIIVILDFYFKVPVVRNAAVIVGKWVVIGAACALGLGLINLIRIHGRHLIRRTAGQWYYSAWLLFLMLVVLFFGGVWSTDHPVFVWLFNSIYLPADATAFSLATLFMASAAYRTFRARSWEAATLLICGAIAMLMNAPVGELIWSGFPALGGWILTYPSGGVYRAITLGIGLGIIFIGIRTLLGLERGYLGAEGS